MESSRNPGKGETKKQLEEIHYEKIWRKLVVFSGGSGQMEKACRRLMLLMEVQNILLHGL
jgi:hypothetical protein